MAAQYPHALSHSPHSDGLPQPTHWCPVPSSPTLMPSACPHALHASHTPGPQPQFGCVWIHTNTYLHVSDLFHTSSLPLCTLQCALAPPLRVSILRMISTVVMTRSTPGPDPVPVSARPRTDPRRFIANVLRVASRHATHSRRAHPHDARTRHGTRGP